MQSITLVDPSNHAPKQRARTRHALAANDALRYLSLDDELRLIAAYKRGEAGAGDALVRNNLGLVVTIARGYRLWGEALNDLVQQGCIGLLKAVQRFDEHRAQNLRTYAGYWIRAEIRDYVVRTYRIVRLGTTRTERRALRAFRVQEIRDPQELADKSGMPLPRCEQLWPLLLRGDTQLDDTRDKYPPLDRLVQDNGTPELLALTSERNLQLRMSVNAALAGLTARERRIVEARMMADDPSTLEALGVELGLSRERVRQLEAAAKAKIKLLLAPELAA
jgi:RNA polymerase sigma-32 factor